MLGHADVSLLLNMSISRLSAYVIGHECATGQLIPRRGTIHDMGPSVTHKAIICYKSLVEKKPTSQVASETFHSPEDVEYYVQCFRRIQLCRDKGLSPDEIAQATGHSLKLVEEYLDLMTKFRIPRDRRLTRKGGSRLAFKAGNRVRLAGSGADSGAPVAGTEPAKSCTDASSSERIVYKPTTSDGQMAVSSVPPDTFPPFSLCR